MRSSERNPFTAGELKVANIHIFIQCTRQGDGSLLRKNVKRSRGGLVFKAHRLVYHSPLVSRVIKKKKKKVTVQVGGTPVTLTGPCEHGLPQAFQVGLHRLFQLLDLYWRSPRVVQIKAIEKDVLVAR